MNKVQEVLRRLSEKGIVVTTQDVYHLDRLAIATQFGVGLTKEELRELKSLAKRGLRAPGQPARI